MEMKRFGPLGIVLLGLVTATPLSAQGSRLPAPIEAGLVLRQADGVKRVLLVAAHPDDEDTALLTTLARGRGAETAYFAFTRGEGGQNLIGSELGEGLGIVRTGELLSAREVDGARQFFSRAFDFGYSKTADETFRQWPRELLLADLVWAIRAFRPHILVSGFSGTPRDGHGQHQAAGILTMEAWEAAGDPGRYPEQLEQGLETWAPLKLYRRAFFDPENATLTIETGRLDPLLGRSHHQIAMESRSRHRSQDFGTAQPPGPRQTHLALIDSRVESGEADPLFTGIDTTLVSFVQPLGPAAQPHVTAYREEIAAARAEMRVTDPAAVLPRLAAARRHLGALVELAGDEAPVELARRRGLLDRAILAVSGVRVEWRSRAELLVPGQTMVVEARVWSGGDASIELAAPELAAPRDWTVAAIGPDVEVEPLETGMFARFFESDPPARRHGETVRLRPGELALWRFEVTVPDDARPTAPYYLERPRSGAVYEWPDRPELRTLPFQPPPLAGAVAIEIESGGISTGVSLAGPVRYRGVDKAIGEFWRPVHVAPRVSVAPEAATLIWPLGDGGARTLAYRVASTSGETVEGTLELDAPPGWRVTPAEAPFAVAGTGAGSRVEFTVTPPDAAEEGEYRLRPVVRTAAGVTDGLEATLIDYPHIEPRLALASGALRIVRFPVRVADRSIGYVMGSGDDGPEAIRQLGLDLEMIEPGDWSADRLERFDTIVLGVRAYEVRPDLIGANPLLLDWVSGGGTLIAQYNKLEFNEGEYAPYPIEIARGRVTDENASVRVLEPESALLAGPNEIRPRDFTGWVQERGLYFPASWDDAYTEVLAMADPDEEEQSSSLLVTPWGEGLYVHTSLAFFRQLPAGVPGAYRLWANLLSIDARRWRETATAS